MTMSVIRACFFLYSSLITGNYGQIETLPVELHATVDLACRSHICAKDIYAVQWYRSGSSDVFIRDGQAVAWLYGEETGNSPGFGINDDFSMIIHNVNLTHRGLYRCIVASVGGGSESTYDFKLNIYAKPVSSPSIGYIRQTNGLNVTCSISHIFPKTFPTWTSYEGAEAAKYNKADGTYNTSVSHLFPLDENTTAECLYSNMNFSSMSSLLVVYIDKHENKEKKPMNESCTNISKAYSLSGLSMIWVTLVIEVCNLSVIVYAVIRDRMMLGPALREITRKDMGDRVREDDQGRNIRVEELVNLTRSVFFGKHYFAMILLTIHTTVIILLGASLANLINVF